MLKAAGFDAVETRLNLPANEMRKALREFGSRSQNADIAVVVFRRGVPSMIGNGTSSFQFSAINGLAGSR